MTKQNEKHKKTESELTSKVLYINRCAKVVKGGRKFSFSALILVGDGNGRVGYGFAKANELTDAIRKGEEFAKNNLHEIVMEGSTIPHEVHVKWDGAEILIKPAAPGTGVVAGSRPRAVFELAGIKDVMAKSLGGNNPLNQVLATFKALQSMKTKDEVKAMRGTVS